MALSADELAKIRAELKAQADLQAKINENTGDYLKLMREIKELNKSIAQIKKKELEQELKTKDAVTAYLAEKHKGAQADKVLLAQLRKNKEVEKAKLSILREELEVVERMTAALKAQAKEASKIAAAFKMVKNDVGNINKIIKVGYSKLKSWTGAFEFDKSMKTSALQMGVLNKQTDSFRTSIQDAANQTAFMGVSLETIAKLQSGYAEELGRNVMLGKEALAAMGEMVGATDLGADGVAKMAAEFEQQGYSALRTRDYVEQTMNDSHKMGLNASKVIKNIANNIKMLNKYQFKGGVKGLAKMAETVTKLGVDMEVVGSMADKLFDVEGAVDMAAQMQVMGGAWSQLADPFKLMYMARNDMEALTQSMAEAAASSMTLGKDGGIELAAMEMQRLKKIAEATGVDYEKLVEMGKAQFKIRKAQSQVKWSMSKEEKEFIAATATFNERGEASIMIGTEPKLLKTLSMADRQTLKQQILEKESLKTRAEAAQTFDEKLTNLHNQFKQLLIPVVEAMDKSLGPILKDLSKSLQDPETIKMIRDTARTIGELIGTIGKFVANNKILTILGFALFETAKWVANGVALGTGFNMATGKGGLMSGIKNMINSIFGKGGSTPSTTTTPSGTNPGGSNTPAPPAAGKFGKMGGGAMGGAVTGILNATQAESAGEGIGNVAGGIIGGALGTLLDPFIGPLGTMLGAQLGSMAGGAIGKWASESGEEQHDARFNSPLHDGKLGSDFSKGRGIVQGGKITPIDNKDDLLAMKPNGPVDKVLNGGNAGGTMKIEFGEIHFKFDELKVTSPGSPGIAIDLLKDHNFIKDITRMVHVETSKVINGGKVKP